MAELIDLSKIPVPDVIKPLSFEQRLAELKELFTKIDPSYSDLISLESDPVNKLLQAFAYREMHLVAQINDATRGNMLASATGNDLFAIGARYGLAPLVIQKGDPSASPPVPEIIESESAFRRRVQMAFNGLNTAGSLDAYVFFALSADGRIADAAAVSPAPCEIVVTVMGISGDGAADDELLAKVRALFGISDDGLSQSEEPSKARPQGDLVTVQSAEIINYGVIAQLQVLPGPDSTVVLAAAKKALLEYQAERRRLGADITRSGIYRALHQNGVNNVLLTSPAADVAVLEHQAAFCINTNITIGSVCE